MPFRTPRDAPDRIDVLWRSARWRCEYAPLPSGGTVRLYMGCVRIAERHTDTLDDMLRVASSWRRAVAGMTDPTLFQ